LKADPFPPFYLSPHELTRAFDPRYISVSSSKTILLSREV